MDLRKLVGRAWAPALAVLVSGALIFGSGGGTPSGTQEINNWSHAHIALVATGESKFMKAEAVQPPAETVLVHASPEGSALGHEINALTHQLGARVIHGNGHASKEAREKFNKLMCFLLSRLLEKRKDPGGPPGLALAMNLTLVQSGLPQIGYSEVEDIVGEIHLGLKRGFSTDELSRKVLQAVLCPD
ncbi:MAG TPA: hypothetical protein VHS74_20290 [Solirubrobacterales bacterium]|jgi:hypothetical protein|nr:hypothetical protein [Solirubrobacterales bacterium]